MAHTFGRKGTLNKQNFCIWSDDNPLTFEETPLHPQKLNFWCALWEEKIISPIFFFKIEGGHNFTVNGERYRMMINNFFVDALSRVGDLWHGL